MVGVIHPAAPRPDAATTAFVRARLAGPLGRFVTGIPGGGLVLGLDGLADVVAEIVADYTDRLIGERDALAEDLAHELNARGGVQPDGGVQSDGGRAA